MEAIKTGCLQYFIWGDEAEPSMGRLIIGIHWAKTERGVHTAVPVYPRIGRQGLEGLGAARPTD